MSNEIELAAELAALEARLSAASLPGTTINRDTLFYQAGWTAAEAKIRRRAVRTCVAWAAACASLAALLLVVSHGGRSDQDTAGTERSAARSPVASVNPEPVKQGTTDRMRLLRRRAELIRDTSDVPFSIQDPHGVAASVERPAVISTRRELLDELLSDNS